MARDFDRFGSQYLEADSAPVTGTPFSATCWFYPDTDGQNICMIWLGDLSETDRFYSIHVAGGLAGDPVRMTRVGAEGWRFTDTTAGVTFNSWNHAAMVCSADNASAVYVNGGNKGTNAQATTPAGWDRISIGRQGDSSPIMYFAGLIAESPVWDAALTDDEVAALAGGVSPLRIRPENLVSYWPLYGIASPEPDYIGTINLTLFNAPPQADHAPVQVPFGYNISWVEPTVAVAAVTAGRLVDSIRLKSLVHGGLT